ncbi:ATP-binding protein [Rhizobacter sp. Root404]|uniref:ATP-binding protein n=1 Tax=Rhizobacter sp. Root404 TaxID=1736528 RepID=UPI000B078DCD|nr:ATP-binding protein [Rhizobacter sp. Root404]
MIPPDPSAADVPYADIFVGQSDMANLMRRHDWAATPLGPPEHWPETLKVALRILLTSRFEMWLGWGPEVAFFYNDAYRPTLGHKHPAALARPTRELWAEIWDDIRGRIESVYRDGVATWDRALHLVLERSGYPEETYHTFSYSPLLGAGGRVEGLFCAVSEETERVLSERRLATLSLLSAGMAKGDTRARAMAAAGDALRAAGRDFPFSLAYLFDADGRPHLAAAQGVEPPSALTPLALDDAAAARWRAAEVYAGANEFAIELEPAAGPWPTGPWPLPPQRALVLAIGGKGVSRPSGLLVLALNRYRPADGDLPDYARLLAGQIGAGLDNADAYDAERRRAAELAEAIQLRQEAAEVLRHANLQLSAEVRARTAERDRLRSLFQQAPGFMCVLGGPEHRYELINESYAQLIGHRDVTGKPIRDALPELEGQGFFELLGEVYANGVPYIGRGVPVMLQREPDAPLEERFLDFVYQPIFDDGGRVSGIFAEGGDVTEQIRAERALLELNSTLETRIAERTEELGTALQRLRREAAEREAAQEALRQSQKMEAVGQLTGGIAHDFNNLLQGITGSLALVRRRLEQGRTNEVDRFIADASHSAKRAAALTHRLLAFSRRQPLDPKPVHANPLIASMADLLRRTLGERIALELALLDGLWLTLCDANQLENAVLNLCINARDAMPDGGTLTVATDNLEVEPDGLGRQGELAPGAYIRIAVTDTGTGMAPQVVSRAFDPFFTTKPLGQGTGLGLSMIYGFARQSGGDVRIDSEPGRGTTVRLFLPRYRGEPLALPGEAAGTGAHRANAGDAVLVIEDEAVVRSLIVEVLGDLGYQAIEAADGPSGLAILMGPRKIDLLVTDIGLPGLNGRQVADAARVHRPELKVLLMTGYAENALAVANMLDAGMALITKPFAIEDLTERLREMMRPAGPPTSSPGL